MNQWEDFERFLDDRLILSRRSLLPKIITMPIGDGTWALVQRRTGGDNSLVTDLITVGLFRAAWTIGLAHEHRKSGLFASSVSSAEHGPAQPRAVDTIEALYDFVRVASRLTGDPGVPEEERFLRILHWGIRESLRPNA